MVSAVPHPSAPVPWIPPADRPGRILLVRLSALGDVMHALPVLEALRSELPDATIDWVVEDRAADLLQGRPELSRLVVLPRRRILEDARHKPWRLATSAGAFLRTLRARRYDVVLDLQGNLKSGIVTRLARARHRYGPARPVAREGNHLFTTRRARPAPSRRHRVERNLVLLASMLGHPVAWQDPGLFVPEDVEREAERRLQAAGLVAHDYVILHPGTSRFGAYKRWPPARFADLARLLRARGETVVVTAPPGEEDLAAEVAEHAGDAVTVLPTPSLPLLGAVTRRARLFIAGDTGPLHLAALAGTPLVGLFGPKDPAIYGPYGRRAHGAAGGLPVLVREDVACRPCRRRTCPDPVCMTGLEAEAVLAAAASILPN